MTNIKLGDKVSVTPPPRTTARSRLGDCAPVFRPVIRAGDKVVRDTATANHGKVCVGRLRAGVPPGHSCRRQSGP